MNEARAHWGCNGGGAAAALVLAAAVGCGAGAPAHAAGGVAQGHLLVSATVKRYTSMRLDAPRVLTISESDVARGYVEVPAAVEVSVQSNVRAGYTLMLENDAGHVREAVVQGPAGAMVIGAGGRMLSRPAAGSGVWRETLQLRVRFQLASGAQAGTYGWPLRISMASD